ncbi:MAG: FkbM family methyltransferase, partial [Acidobacteriota bacterium]
MKLASLAKPFLSLYVSPLKSNRYLQKYVFSVPLKKEVTDFIENVYFQEYLHIEKSIDLARKLKLENMDILDVGGAIGNTARLYAKNFPQSKVWVFEPMQETYRKLQAATSSFPNIRLVNKAVGNTVGKTVINRA